MKKTDDLSLKSRPQDRPQKFGFSAEPYTAVRIGIVGCGYWGPNLIRNFHELKQSQVVAVCDLQKERLKPLAKRYPGVRLTTKFREILRDSSIDAVVVATPISTHYSIASEALKAGKHVLVEKPLAANAREGRALLQLAHRCKKILMVGHTFEYNPAVLKVAELLKRGELGKLRYIDSVRVNLGLYQSDGRNVIWDLAPHDISIILHWVGEIPKRVSAWGRSFVQEGIEDVAFLRLEFPDNVVAHLHVSWLAPTKIRRITAVGDKKMIVYDDLESVEKIKIADRSAHSNRANSELRIGYRMGDIVSPRIDVTEPLSQECLHFIECVLRNQTPRSDGEKGVQVVQVLEACDKSIKRGGRIVSV